MILSSALNVSFIYIYVSVNMTFKVYCRKHLLLSVPIFFFLSPDIFTFPFAFVLAFCSLEPSLKVIIAKIRKQHLSVMHMTT